MQGGAILARETLAKEGKLDSTLQACAADAARRGASFFVLPEGVASSSCCCSNFQSSAPAPTQADRRVEAESTLQACAADAARRSTFFLCPP